MKWDIVRWNKSKCLIKVIFNSVVWGNDWFLVFFFALYNFVEKFFIELLRVGDFGIFIFLDLKGMGG